MQVDEKTRRFWNKYREDGDVQELAKITNRDRSTISNLLNGQVECTSTVVAMAITKFYVRRKKDRDLMERVTRETDCD